MRELLQNSSSFAHTPAANVTLVPAQGAGKIIVIKRITFSVALTEEGTLLLYDGSIQCFPKVSISSTAPVPIYDSGEMELKLSANTALKFTDTSTDVTDLLVQWETEGGFP